MKIHRSLVDAVVQGLNTIFNEGRYADKAIERILKSNRKWGSRDRAFIAEYIYDTVRWWRLLGYAAECEQEHDMPSCWKRVGVMLMEKGNPLPDWKEFKDLDPEVVEKRMHDKTLPHWIRASVPDWLYQTGVKELGAQWPNELDALNNQASLVIRVNTLKSDVQGVRKRLEKEGVLTETIQGIPDALKVLKRANLFGFEAFKEGLFDIQDASSQRIAPLLQVEPGMRVIDACAGAGGKSLHLAAMMNNKGHLISMDTSERKLEELMRRARRAGVNNTETRVIDGTKVIKRLEGTADRLLLDVPCSGMGVLRRNPDAKWKLDADFLQRIQETQHEIISKYSAMLKPGGLMVYATCSILPSENEKQVDRFLSQNSQFSLVEQHRISATEGYDGFFMSLLKRQL